jgi:aspartyl-tRNA(Asn)/glutamyl-tRNA(Gln) amidotransferase subunit A
MTEKLIGKSIGELRRLLDSKEVKAREIAEVHLAHAAECDKELGTFNCLTPELALAQADRVDDLIAAGKAVSRLAGIPIAIKDNMCVPGYPTTCSSKILHNFVPVYQATVVERLSEALAIFVGKTNMDEFAMGSSTENSATKLCRNPWDLKRVPGGSSGGSAGAVACGSAVVALGSDTGGSIRQPASCCGVAGMKPTYGTVSRFGLIAFASSLDQIGPFGRCVADVAEVLNVISGHDEKDSSSYRGQLPDYLESLNKPIKGLKIGLIQELIGEGIDEDVRKAILAAADTYRDLGASVVEVSMPQLRHSLPAYYLIATAEASANLARFDGVRYGHRCAGAEDILTMYFKTRQEGFGPEVKRRIMLGTYALSSGYYDAYYKKAQQVRRLIKEEFDNQFKSLDLLITPTAPSVAFEIGAKVDDPLTMYLSDIATIPANLAGIPGISLPCGFGEANMPIGLQILAPPLADATALQAAHAFEQATSFHKEHPEHFFSKSTINAEKVQRQ